jgi:hypothetical protein
MLLENKDNRGGQIVDDDDWRAKGLDASRLMPGMYRCGEAGLS